MKNSLAGLAGFRSEIRKLALNELMTAEEMAEYLYYTLDSDGGLSSIIGPFDDLIAKVGVAGAILEPLDDIINTAEGKDRETIIKSRDKLNAYSAECQKALFIKLYNSALNRTTKF